LAPEFNDKNEYIEHVCQVQMPALAKLGLIDCVDVFCESIGFSLQQTRQVFETARQLQLPVKLHAEQLSSLGGSELAARYNAWSVDHIEYLPASTVPLLKSSGTVATLLPGAFYFLNETQKPPVEALRQHQVPIAIASDCNPGSSPCVSLLSILNMACVLFGLTPAEALAGVTRHAAKALRLDQQVGQINPGFQADLALWQIEHPAELSYMLGHNPCQLVVKKGEIVLNRL
jgi:imidazolonepropionase